MIINGYVDESEDDTVFVLAGFVAPAEEWTKFSDVWQAALDAKPRVRLLKTSDAMHSPPRGEFWGLSEEARNEKLRTLYAIIDDYVSFEVSAVVHMEPLKRIFGGGDFPNQAANPYYHGVTALIDVVIRRQIECGMKEKVDFVFDERLTEQGKLLSVWDAVVHDAPSYIKSMIGKTPSFKKDDEVRPLQAADLEAWWLRRRCIERLRGLPRLEYPWVPTPIPWVSSLLGEAELQKTFQRMLKMKNDLAILGLG